MKVMHKKAKKRRKRHPFVKRKKEPTPSSTRARSCSTDWGALLPASFPGSNLRQIVEKKKIKPDGKVARKVGK